MMEHGDRIPDTGNGIRSQESRPAATVPAAAQPAGRIVWRVLTVSNAISCFRLLLVAPLAALLASPRPDRPLVLAVFAAAYISDLLDGWLARRLDQVSEAGKVIDPLADKVFILAAALLLTANGFLPLGFVLLVVLRDVAIFSAGALLASRRAVVPPSTMTGKMAVVSIGLVLLASLYRVEIPADLFLAGMAASIALQAASLVVYGRRFLHIMQRKPTQDSGNGIS